jgi:hypothetical protein
MKVRRKSVCYKRLKTLDSESLDLENEVKEMAGRKDKDRKETEKETARLAESLEKQEEIVLEERKVIEEKDRK